MKSQNTAVCKLLIALLAAILILTGMNTAVLATGDEEEEEEPAISYENAPHIEMKVKPLTVGSEKQVLVECYGKDYTCLEGFEVVFSYDCTKLTPSYISGERQNEILDGLEAIKYENRPTSASQREAFDAQSKEILMNSFENATEYSEEFGKHVLDVDVFRYIASADENKEVFQFIVSRKDYVKELTATDSILLGTFSFKLEEETDLEGLEFKSQRIKIMCDDGEGEDPDIPSIYIQEVPDGTFGGDEDLISFEYLSSGSIYGTVVTGYYNSVGEYNLIGKNLATVYLFDAEDVKDIDWEATGTEYQANRRKTRPIIEGTYSLQCRVDLEANPEIAPLFTTQTDEEGNFYFIDGIEIGKEYVLLVDKEDYGDYVITNLTIDSSDLTKVGPKVENEQGQTEIGDIQIAIGDFDKDGLLNKNDRTIFLFLYGAQDRVEEAIQRRAFDLTDDDTLTKEDRTIMLQSITSSMNTTIKVVQDWSNQNEAV